MQMVRWSAAAAADGTALIAAGSCEEATGPSGPGKHYRPARDKAIVGLFPFLHRGFVYGDIPVRLLPTRMVLFLSAIELIAQL